MQKKSLNVLMVAFDDLRPNLGCYGDANAITPHIDKLAQNGVVFNRAYCQQAVCNPSRASLMTGCYPDTTRVWDLKAHFREAMPNVVTLSQHFKNHGYQSDCIGKIYHGSAGVQDAPSWSSEAELTHTREYKYVLPENIDAKTKGFKKAAATECADVDDSAYIDGMVADRTVERMKELADIDRPFFLSVGFRKPHLPFSAPKKYWDMQDKESIGVIANPLPPEDVPEIALHDWVELRGYSDIPDLGPLSPAQEAHLRHGYYAATSYADAQLGKVIAELDRLGLRETTVICLWGDHGWHLGEHGLWCKTTNFELDTRSPLIFCLPDGRCSGRSTDALAEFVDVYPTLAELCGLPLPEALEGTSLVPVLDDPDAVVRDCARSQFPRPWPEKKDGFSHMGYSIRTDRYRYTEWREMPSGASHARELYDHNNDSMETVNLAGHDDHADIAAELQNLLTAAFWGELNSASKQKQKETVK